MTRLNKVKKLEERIAPSMLGLGVHLNANASGDVGGISVDSHATANVHASASSGWANPLLYVRALEQQGLIESSANLESSFDTTIYKY
jgi:hypothetical protein